MINLIIEEKKRPIHIWTGAAKKIMVSFEDTKTLLSYDCIDDAVNSLYIKGYKEAAKTLNKQGVYKNV